MIYAGRMSESRKLVEQAASLLPRMIATDPTNTEWPVRLRVTELFNRTLLGLAQGDLRRAEPLSRSPFALYDGPSARPRDLAGPGHDRPLAGDVQFESKGAG